MSSKKRRQGGKLARLTPEHRRKRAERRQRKKTWATRVWAKRHAEGQD